MPNKFSANLKDSQAKFSKVLPYTIFHLYLVTRIYPNEGLQNGLIKLTISEIIILFA